MLAALAAEAMILALHVIKNTIHVTEIASRVARSRQIQTVYQNAKQFVIAHTTIVTRQLVIQLVVQSAVVANINFFIFINSFYNPQLFIKYIFLKQLHIEVNKSIGPIALSKRKICLYSRIIKKICKKFLTPFLKMESSGFDDN